MICILGAPTNYTGVSLSCAEFGSAIPGTYNKDYTFPTHDEVDYFKSKGGNIVRFPFMWERAQPNANGPFDATYFGMIDEFVNYATSQNVYVLLDPHNYARYYSLVIGESNNTADTLTNLWKLLASKYASNSKVFFGLMNEPNSMKTETWLNDANVAIDAIRSVGAKNLIFVPGNAWTGAWTWDQNWYGTPNSQVMLGVKDSANNFVFEVHQYLDQDGSGSGGTCVSTTSGVDRVTNFTLWARTNHYKAFLGEYAGGNNDVCQQAITGLLNYMDSNQDVWVGWSWWAAGPWWGDDSWGSIEPSSNGQDKPQMAWLEPHMQPH